jgi:crotonobetainyl-CoA:carnitine CoA-transferase CaiB-like acyl-CoA transferase
MNDGEGWHAGSAGPLLEGIRVVDLSRVLAGPYAGQVMAEMGADVIKVEPPEGDPARGIGPHLNGRSVYFSSLNTGKRGIVLDLRISEGRHALEALLGSADVVLHNFRPSTAAALDVDAASLLRRHPSLVVVTIAGFAGGTPDADVGAFDLTIQAETGLMAVTGERGRPPVRAGAAVSDLVSGLWAVLGAVAALLARERGGLGRHVEVPMVDATLPLLSYMASSALATGVEPEKVGSGHHTVYPYGAYPTADGWIAVAVLSDKFWPRLCGALEMDSLSGDPGLATNDGRRARSDEVEETLVAAFSRLTIDEAARRLRQAEVPHAPVRGVLDALATPYVRSRGMVVEVPTPEGPYSLITGPLAAGQVLRPAPSLGEHTNEVLEEILGPEVNPGAARGP